MPRIPVLKEDFPLEVKKIDESLIYRVVVKRLTVSEKPDKNDNHFLKLDSEVVEPVEWRGRHILDNYIPIPPQLTADMDQGDRRAAEELGVRIARLLTCFRVPSVEGGFDTEGATGCMGDVTAQNEDFEGRNLVRVREYLI